MILHTFAFRVQALGFKGFVGLAGWAGCGFKGWRVCLVEGGGGHDKHSLRLLSKNETTTA